MLHCTLSLAAQCIIIGPVCLCVGVFVYGSVTTITRNCVHRSSPNLVGKGSDHLQLKLIKFWPSCASGKGSAAGRKFLAPPNYSQLAVFASLRALFSFKYRGTTEVINILKRPISIKYGETIDRFAGRKLYCRSRDSISTNEDETFLLMR